MFTLAGRGFKVIIIRVASDLYDDDSLKALLASTLALKPTMLLHVHVVAVSK